MTTELVLLDTPSNVASAITAFAVRSHLPYKVSTAQQRGYWGAPSGSLYIVAWGVSYAMLSSLPAGRSMLALVDAKSITEWDALGAELQRLGYIENATGPKPPDPTPPATHRRGPKPNPLYDWAYKEIYEKGRDRAEVTREYLSKLQESETRTAADRDTAIRHLDKALSRRLKAARN